jgi:DNA repair protein RecO (recombination protein O)
MERVELEPAFVLHGRPYRETSQLLEVLASEHGRLGIVARGARTARTRWRAVLQPFQPLRLSWSGRGSLCTLRGAESAGLMASLSGTGLMSAYYLNELVLALTTRGDPHPDLFAHYARALHDLAAPENAEAALRRFEVALLAEIGYGLALDRDAEGGEPVADDRWYAYVPERGPVPVIRETATAPFSGAQLRAIGAGEFRDASDLRAAKRLLRAVLAHHLGGRPLRTRAVMAAMRGAG